MATVSGSQLSGFLDNIRSIGEENQPFEIDYNKKKGLSCKYVTSYGSMSEQFDVQKSEGPNCNIRVLPETVRDFMRLIPSGDVRLAFCSPPDNKGVVLVVEGHNRSLGYMTRSLVAKR